MAVKPGVFSGLTSYTIENEWLKMIVLPELGGKIASLQYKPQQFEVLFQPSAGQYQLPRYGADFACYDTSGADEMYPTIDRCPYPAAGFPGVHLPDHGELWSIPWTTAVTDDGLVSRVHGIALPYTFERTLRLQRQGIHMDYRVRNTGQADLYGLWAFHGLVCCDEGSKLVLPQTYEVMNVHDSAVLGRAGTVHSFPLSVGQAGQRVDLSRIGPRSLQITAKFYVQGKVAQGTAGLTLNSGQLLYHLTFPHERVPYLGVWVNAGGFKGEYNCALEPSTGYYDSLQQAYRSKSLLPVKPGAVQEWSLHIDLIPLK